MHLINHIKENLEKLEEGLIMNVNIARTFTKIPKHISPSDISVSRLLLMKVHMIKLKLTMDNKPQEFFVQNLGIWDDTSEGIIRNYNHNMFGYTICSFVKTDIKKVIKEVEVRARKKLSAKILPNFMRDVRVDEIELNSDIEEACVVLSATPGEESDDLQIRVRLHVKNNKITIDHKRSMTID